VEQPRLERLVDLSRDLVSELDLDTLLERVLDVARDLTGARYAALGVLDARREGLAPFVTAGIDRETHQPIGELPRGRGVLGELVRDPRPLRIDDVAQHPSSYGFPIGHPPMTTFLGVPILICAEAWGNLYLTEKAGGPFDEDDERVMVLLAGHAATAIENARLYEEVRARRDGLEHAVRGFEATAEIARAVGREFSLDRVLELICKRGRALVSARAMVIALLRGDGIVVETVAGQVDPALVGVHAPLEASVSGEVVRTRRPRRLAEDAGRAPFVFGEYLEARAGLFVPLLFRGRALGVLAAFDRLEDGPELVAEDERLLLSYAASAATAVGTAQNVAAEGARHALRASEEERRRWARELHDETLQDLAALRLLLSGARRSGDPERQAAAVEEAVAQVDTGIAGLRALITDLRPAVLDDLGLAAAIESLAERHERATGHGVTLALEDVGGRLPRDVEVVLFRVVQEALTNIAKHAEATAVRVELRAGPAACARSSPTTAAGSRSATRRAAASACSGCASASRSPAGGSTSRARRARARGSRRSSCLRRRPRPPRAARRSRRGRRRSR